MDYSQRSSVRNLFLTLLIPNTSCVVEMTRDASFQFSPRLEVTLAEVRELGILQWPGQY
jgi:hypothetical protein